MVTISKARNSVRLQTYHEKELSNAQENYYTKNDQIEGEWRGKLAAHWGLTGPITSEQFARLADGQHPSTGEQLIRHRLATDSSVEHRAGWDATFSAPKSVSLTALVGGLHAQTPATRDLARQVAEAHRQAARVGADYLERYVEARMGGNKPTQSTGAWVAALFDHDSSRPVQGYAAPQLHTHVVVFNMTQDPEGKVRALNEKSLFEAQKAATAVYQAELRSRLEHLGFQVELGKNNAPEIVGYTEDYRRANSTRSEIIDVRAEELRQQLGISGVQARQMAALETRERKLSDTPEQMHAKHIARAAEYGHQERAVLDQALHRQQAIAAERQQIDPMKEAHKALTFARDHLFEHEAVNTETDLIRTALTRAEGRATFQHIEAALKERQDNGEFLLMKNTSGRRAYTTADVLRMERENIRLMVTGKRCHGPLVTPARIREENFNRLDSTGTGNQRDAAYQILTSRDRIQGLQGAAGTGKTFTLKTVREELENNGWRVRGFAPTSKASKELADSGIQTTTLQKYLIEAETKPKPPDPTVYVLDESSLADAPQVNRLLKSLGPEDRLVLVGDVRQHEAVGQGRAFAQLQEQGMSTAQLTKIIRQKDAPDLKRVVELFYEGRIHEGVDILKKLDCIKEVKNEQQRYEAIAKEFMSERDHTLVISPDNRSRAGINAVIHRHLQEAGQLDKSETRVQVLVNRQDISKAERGWAKRYEVGNVLRYERPSEAFGFKQGEYVTVTGVDSKDNTITVQRPTGETVTYDPERFKGPTSVSIYRPDEKAFSVGELVQFTSNSKDLGISNRDRAVITGFTQDGNIAVSMYKGADSPPGRSLTINPRQFGHLDHAYAVTSYSSQGLTERADILNIDTNNMNPQLINDRLAYVAGSRMKLKLTIYCNDANHLADALARDISKTSAIRPPAQREAEHLEPPDLSDALGKIAAGDTTAGMERLKSLGCVIEVKDDAERRKAVAQEYIATGGRAVIVTPEPLARAAINEVIHSGIKSAGKTDHTEIAVPVLIRRQDITDEQRRSASAYRRGDVIRYEGQRRTVSLMRAEKEYATVTAVDPKNNTITVQRPDGTHTTYDPETRHRVSIYASIPKSFTTGETVRFTTDYPPVKVRRDDKAKLLGIAPDGKLTLRLIPPDGKRHRARTIQVDPAKFRHLDHTYTTGSSFGPRPPANAPTVVHLDGTLTNVDAVAQRLARAAEIRRDPRLKIYCQDSQALGDALARSLAAHQQSTVRSQVPQDTEKALRMPTATERSHERNLEQTTIESPSIAVAQSTARPERDRTAPVQQPIADMRLTEPGHRPTPEQARPGSTYQQAPQHTTAEQQQGPGEPAHSKPRPKHQHQLEENTRAHAPKPPRSRAAEQAIEQEPGLSL